MDPWGKAYEIVTRRLKSRESPVMLTRKRAVEVIECLFPAHEPINWITEKDTSSIPFMESELFAAVEKMSNKKAPGPDKLPPEVIKAAVAANTSKVLAFMNSFCRRDSFPHNGK